jgi:polysaccharide export outer membrane protein
MWAAVTAISLTGARPLFAQDQQQVLPLPEALAAQPTDAAAPASAEPAATTGATDSATPTDATKASDAAAAAAAAVEADDASAYQIGPEDVLDISVWKNPELSRTVPVRPDGKVSLPLVNDIKAAGLTPTTLREQVTAKLSEFIPAPEVSVIVREVHSRKVAVIGSVKTPGRFDLKSPMTVLEAIALAQGFTDFAARDRIVVLRQMGKDTVRIPFNFRKVADGAIQGNFVVQAGDVIVVP